MFASSGLFSAGGLLVLLALFSPAAVLAAEQKTANLPRYSVGEAIPVSCLNRTIDTGEHVADEQGRLQYIPFPVCAETGKSLELYFGVEKDIECTIDFIDDTFFHLLEFYIHNDAPLTCRIPSRPLFHNSPASDASFAPDKQVGVLGSESSAYIPLVVAVSGVLQLSHLHVAPNLNLLLHAAPKMTAPGVIDSAIAYSTGHATKTIKVVIGDRLPLKISVRWYHSPALPSGWTGVGGHLTGTTVLYCLLAAGASAAICTAYFRGVELPRRLKTHGRDRVGTLSRADSFRGGYAVGNGYGFGSGPGKFD